MLYYRKKESNKKHYIKLIIIIGIIILSLVVPMANTISSNILLTILKPINKVASTISYEIQTVIDNAFGTKPNREMVKKLTIENEQLKSENDKLQLLVNDSELLKNEYEMMRDPAHKAAKVIALGSEKNFNNFIIDKGKGDGIKKGDIVVSAFVGPESSSMGALVGKVQEVYLNTSSVTSIMDAKFNLTFKHRDSNAFGVINSRFSGLLEGYMLDKKVDINKGDKVLTSGIGGVYQEGLLIGKVVDVSESPDELKELVKIESPIDFNRLYDVFVISGQGEINE